MKPRKVGLSFLAKLAASFGLSLPRFVPKRVGWPRSGTPQRRPKSGLEQIRAFEESERRRHWRRSWRAERAPGSTLRWARQLALQAQLAPARAARCLENERRRVHRRLSDRSWWPRAA